MNGMCTLILKDVTSSIMFNQTDKNMNSLFTQNITHLTCFLIKIWVLRHLYISLWQEEETALCSFQIVAVTARQTHSYCIGIMYYVA